jgi:two-component system NtrC family sensor kinase
LFISRIVADFFRILFHPRDFFKLLGTDYYKNLKIKIVLTEVILSIIPLLIVVTISYFWFQSILKEDYRNELKWQIGNSKQSIEFFIHDKLSALRFFSSAYTFDQLSDQQILTTIFTKFKKEFEGFIDLGVIDSNGIQQGYVGPYRLKGKDYSNQDWFQEVVIRSAYTSDVFLGYRKIPHFAIAIKSEVPEERTFWVIRATIDVKTLEKYISTINLREEDDAFIVDTRGMLQTPSRYHGNVLEKFTPHIEFSQGDIKIVDTKYHNGHSMFGYGNIIDTPWILVTCITSTPYSRIPNIFRNELMLIILFSISIVMLVTIGITHATVNRIKKAEQEREDAIAKSEHASKLASIGRLAAGVAHEINNPLAIINEKAGLMKDLVDMSSKDSKKNKEKLLPLFDGIFNSVDRCRRITRRLLGFSRQMDVTPEVMDMNDVVKDVIGFLEKEFIFRNIRLEVNLAENLPKISSHKGQLQQVFLNIINNALDAIEEKGGYITISSRTNVDNVQVTIKDNGRGISKDVLNHIFEPFFTTKEEGEGTGLGLFISYGIVNKLGGKIHVESEINKGTTFIVEIPIKSNFI